jgi:RNA polymerase sigma factor (sigma-70 family)
MMNRYYQGKDDALGEIHGRHQLRLQCFALKRLPTHLAARRELAEDLVSNTFKLVVATRKSGKARWSESKGLVRVWLTGILKNQIVSFLRVRKGKEVLGVDRLQVDEEGRELRFEETIADREPAVEARLSLAEEILLLQQFIASLPDEHQGMLVLKYQANLSHGEIGKVFGVSVPTVSRRLHESRRRLFKFLDLPAGCRA